MGSTENSTTSDPPSDPGDRADRSRADSLLALVEVVVGAFGAYSSLEVAGHGFSAERVFLISALNIAYLFSVLVCVAILWFGDLRRQACDSASFDINASKSESSNPIVRSAQWIYRGAYCRVTQLLDLIKLELVPAHWLISGGLFVVIYLLFSLVMSQVVFKSGLDQAAATDTWQQQELDGRTVPRLNLDWHSGELPGPRTIARSHHPDQPAFVKLDTVLEPGDTVLIKPRPAQQPSPPPLPYRAGYLLVVSEFAEKTPAPSIEVYVSKAEDYQTQYGGRWRVDAGTQSLTIFYIEIDNPKGLSIQGLAAGVESLVRDGWVELSSDYENTHQVGVWSDLGYVIQQHEDKGPVHSVDQYPGDRLISYLKEEQQARHVVGYTFRVRSSEVKTSDE